MDANIVTLTDAAANHIQKMFKEQDIGFRLGDSTPAGLQSRHKTEKAPKIDVFSKDF